MEFLKIEVRLPGPKCCLSRQSAFPEIVENISELAYRRMIIRSAEGNLSQPKQGAINKGISGEISHELFIPFFRSGKLVQRKQAFRREKESLGTFRAIRVILKKRFEVPEGEEKLTVFVVITAKRNILYFSFEPNLLREHKGDGRKQHKYAKADFHHRNQLHPLIKVMSQLAT